VSLVLFPVPNPSAFDAVICDENGRVERVVVKQPEPGSNWVWGAVTASGRAFHELRMLWSRATARMSTWAICSTPTLRPETRCTPRANGEHYMDVGRSRAITMHRTICAHITTGKNRRSRSPALLRRREYIF